MMRSPLKSKKSSFIPQYWTRTITTSVMSGFLLRTLVSNLKSMSNVYISTIRLYCNQIFFKPRSWQKSWPGRALDKCPGQSGRPQGWQGCRVARVAGRQKVATPSGSRGGKNCSGSLIGAMTHDYDGNRSHAESVKGLIPLNVSVLP